MPFYMSLNLFSIICNVSIFLLTASKVSAQDFCSPPPPDAAATYTGVKQIYHKNGKIAAIVHYLNGEKHGEMITYFENGGISARKNYKEGYLHGKGTWYYENGKIQIEHSYMYDQFFGKSTAYHENGNLAETSAYSDGRLTGYYRSYHANGKPHTACIYLSGGIDGDYYRYHDNGQLEYKLSYTKGVVSQNGRFDIYYANGSLKETEDYDHGIKTGNWKKYDEQGNLTEEASLKKSASSGMKIKYHPNGNLHAVVRFQKAPANFRSYDGTPNEFREQGPELIFDDQENLMRTNFYFSGRILRILSSEESGKNTWKLMFNDHELYATADSSKKNLPLVEGHLENNMYLFDRIIDFSGKSLLRKGRGSYFGPYCFVNEVDVATSDSLNYFDFFRRFTDMSYYDVFRNEWYVFENTLPRANIISDSYNWVPSGVMASGKFQNGKKEGTWLEGNFIDPSKTKLGNFDDKGPVYSARDINLEYPYACYAMGQYAANKKEGLWKLVTGNTVIEGNYRNNKKEGIWICRSKKIEDKYKDYFYTADGIYDTLSNRLLLTGKFTNGLPDSTWTLYDKKTGHIRKKIVYRLGKEIGITDEYYATGALKLHGERASDSMVYAYYSPLGDRVKLNDFNHSIFCAMTNGKTNGPCYTWDYIGNIITKEFYKNGVPEGDWLKFRGKDTTYSAHYTNGLLEGKFYDYTGENRVSGNMKNGERDGVWLETGGEYEKILKYTGGKCYLMQYTENHVQLIKNGNGKIKETDKDGYYVNPNEHYAPMRELYYKDGLLSRKKEFYKSGTLKSDTYFSERGDSLAIYNSVYGGLCINKGQGSITESDHLNRIYLIKFFEDGRLQKEEFYEKGKYRYTKVHFLSKYEAKPVIKRKISPIRKDEYLVQVTISNLVNLTPFLKFIETLPEDCVVKPGSMNDSRTLISNNSLTFIWTTNQEEMISVSYVITHKPGGILNPHYAGELRFVRNNTSASVFIQNRDIDFVP
jgi:antitoxin component YwqK of YwqJK toxin-antitoxin module